MSTARPGVHVEEFELVHADGKVERVRVWIDVASLAGLGARKARANKSRMTRLLLGAVQVRVAEVERA